MQLRYIMMAAFIGLVTGAQAALICELDATVPGSVVTNASGVAIDWLDQSGSGNDAGTLARIGNPIFPSTSLSLSGLAGIDFLSTRNGYRLFSATEQDSWLDFSGAASGNSGFAVLVAVKVDAVTASNRDTIFANHGNAATTPGSFILKYENGKPTVAIGGTTYAKSGTLVAAGNTLIMAFNYNATTGAFELWDNVTGTSLSNTKAAADFSSTQPLYLGTSENGAQFIDGSIGEVLVYDEFLDATTFSNKYTELTDKWAVAAGIATPSGLTALGVDSAVELDWADDVTGFLDFYTVYRSTISGSINYVALTNVTSSAFVDTDVTNGITYFYAVTATGTNAVETVFSDEVTATPTTVPLDVVVSFPVTDTVPRNLLTVTLDFEVDGSGNVILDASTSNGGAAPTALVDAWDGVVGSVTNSALYNTSFTLTGVAKTNDVVISELRTDADFPGPGLGVQAGTIGINGAGLEKIEWTMSTADDVRINFKTVEYTNRVANGDSNLTFLDSDSREEYLLPNTSLGGSLDLSTDGFSLADGQGFTVTTDDLRPDNSPRDPLAGAALLGLTFEVVPRFVTVSFPVTDTVPRNLLTITLDFDVDGSGNVTLDASTSNGGAAPKAVVDAWDGPAGSVESPLLYNTSFTLTGVAKTNDVAINELRTDADFPGPGLGAQAGTIGINGAGLEKIEWTLTTADGVDINFQTVEYTNRVANGDSNLTFLDEDSRVEYLLPNTSPGGSLDLVGDGFALANGQTFTVTTDDLRPDNSPRDPLAGAALLGFTFEAVPAPGINVTFPNNTIAPNSIPTNRLGELVLDFTIDGSGIVTMDATTTSSIPVTVAAVDAWDGNVGFITNATFFNTAFQMKMSDEGGYGPSGEPGGITPQMLMLTDNSGGGLGVGGLNAWRVDRGGEELINLEATSVPVGRIQITAVNWNNRANASSVLVLDTPTTTLSNALGSAAGVWNLMDEVTLSLNQVLSFTTPVSTNLGNGYALAGFSFDIVEAGAASYAAWAAGWGTSIGSETNDFDADGLNNLYEYGLDGNPVNGTVDPAVLPALVPAGSGLEYVHIQRNSDASLVYTVESTTDLVFGSWTNADSSVTGTEISGGAFDSITNSVSTTEDQLFLRLKIEN